MGPAGSRVRVDLAANACAGRRSRLVRVTLGRQD
jgi:hypothetical protein